MWQLLARDVNANGVHDITDPWPVKDIVYCAIIGSVMLAALLEWFLWLAAFLYCLVKVYRKAENTSIKVLAVIMMVLFTALRSIFLPIMVVTLPLPSQVTQYFPLAMVEFLQWFAFWSFAGLLTIPWLFCVYQLVTHTVGRKKKIKHVLDESSAPKVVIVMPCYNEVPEILLRTIDSLVDCEYPPSCLHIFLSFDGDEENELYLNTIEKLGVPLTLDSYPRSIDVTYRSCRITVSRFKHGGKRHCQKCTFKLVDKIYAEYLKRNDNLFILFIDSDCILDKVCIQNFMYEMELKPGSKQNMLAMTGVITSTTEKNSLITLLQDMEYIHGQLFERSVESGCGAVTCLPGALTILRFSAFRKMAKYYFADKAEQCDDLFDYGKCHLGEDRWLTHLFMIGAKERYQIQMNPAAFCKTEAVQTYRSLLKQRRRWFLGFITNEVCMLTDVRLWKRYTILCIVRFMQNTIRTTALLFFIMVISIITTSQKIQQLPVGFIAVSLGLNWVLMLYFGAKLGRYKIMLYPVMFVVNPFFNWVYMVYGIFTAGQRTWGGPRADAGKATTDTTPADAIAHAEATGDDLNVVPETFKPAVEAQKARAVGPTPLQPTDHIDGRFTAARRLSGGWYQQANDSGLTFPDMLPRNPNAPHVPLHPRASFDSVTSAGTASNSIYVPRRVESFMDPEDARLYHKNQAMQRPAGGAFYESRPDGVPASGEKPSKDSIDYNDSDDEAYAANGKQPQRGAPPPHSRNFSGNSTTSTARTRSPGPASPGPGSSPLGSSPLSTEFGQDSLAVPRPSHGRTSSGERVVSTVSTRNGRSPLGRASFIRTAQEGDAGIELREQRRRLEQSARAGHQSQTTPLADPRARSSSPAYPSPARLAQHTPQGSTGSHHDSPAPEGERGRSDHQRMTSEEKRRRRRLTKSRPGSRDDGR